MIISNYTLNSFDCNYTLNSYGIGWGCIKCMYINILVVKAAKQTSGAGCFCASFLWKKGVDTERCYVV
jgi:hypothetical protein